MEKLARYMGQPPPHSLYAITLHVSSVLYRVTIPSSHVVDLKPSSFILIYSAKIHIVH